MVIRLVTTRWWHLLIGNCYLDPCKIPLKYHVTTRWWHLLIGNMMQKCGVVCVKNWVATRWWHLLIGNPFPRQNRCSPPAHVTTRWWHLLIGNTNHLPAFWNTPSVTTRWWHLLIGNAFILFSVLGLTDYVTSAGDTYWLETLVFRWQRRHRRSLPVISCCWHLLIGNPFWVTLTRQPIMTVTSRWRHLLIGNRLNQPWGLGGFCAGSPVAGDTYWLETQCTSH